MTEQDQEKCEEDKRDLRKVQRFTLCDMRDFGASGMVVGLVDRASFHGDQVLTHAVARQSRQRRVVVHEQTPQIAVTVGRVGVRELEDEVRGTERLSLRQLGLEVELICRIAAHYRHTNAEYRHDRRQPNSRRRHVAMIAILTALISDIHIQQHLAPTRLVLLWHSDLAIRSQSRPEEALTDPAALSSGSVHALIL